ncbi:MAG: hypothetical protein V3T86_00665 [Planctomycetota bacterium]
MRHLILFVLLAAVGMSTITACSSKKKDDVLLGGKVEIPTQARRGYNWPPKKPPEWFDDKIARVRRLQSEEDLKGALDLIDVALAERPAPGHDQTLRSLRGGLLKAILDLLTMQIRVDPVEDPIRFGDAVRVRLEIKNVSGRDLFIPAQAKNLSRSLFRLEIIQQEFTIRADVVLRRRKVHVHLERDIVLEPGGVYEQVLTLEGAGNERPVEGFRTYTVRGTLRPVRYEVGGLPRFEAVRVRGTRMRSFARNFEHLADDPVARIGEAISKQAPQHVLTAAALVRPRDRQAATDSLIEALNGSAMDSSIVASLQYLTGIQEFGRDAIAWKAWWPRVRGEFYGDE